MKDVYLTMYLRNIYVLRLYLTCGYMCVPYLHKKNVFLLFM